MVTTARLAPWPPASIIDYPRDEPVHDYQRDFIELTLRRGVLRFGEFTLKSGRQSPYF